MLSAAKVIKYPAFTDFKLYLVSSIFIASSIVFPNILHHFGIGGQIFLPLYFFSILAGLTYGAKCGVLVGLLTPIISFALSGMPPVAILQFILFKSALIGFLAGLFVEKFNGKNLLLIALIAILISQLLGSLYIYIFTKNAVLSLMDIKTGYIGLILQLTLVPIISKKLQYGNKTTERNS